MSRLDLVIFGATGFTGKYAVMECARIAKKEPGLTWGIAGRSQSKLNSVLEEASKKTGEELSSIPVLIADVGDEESLFSMCQRAKVVINCCGPYRLYGEPVVAAAVRAKTHYVDISGEPQFIETIQLRYDSPAREAGVYIISACGFDSIPNDLGVVFLEQNFEAKTLTYICPVSAPTSLEPIGGPSSGGLLYAYSVLRSRHGSYMRISPRLGAYPLNPSVPSRPLCGAPRDHVSLHPQPPTDRPQKDAAPLGAPQRQHRAVQVRDPRPLPLVPPRVYRAPPVRGPSGLQSTLNSVESYITTRVADEQKALARQHGVIHRGTWESVVYGVTHRNELPALRNKLYPARLPAFIPKLGKRSIHKKWGGWCVPFPGSDSSIVYRTQRELYAKTNKRPVQFRVYFQFPDFLTLVGVLFVGFVLVVFSLTKVTRNWLIQHPTFFSFGTVTDDVKEEVMDNTHFQILLYGEGWGKDTDETKPTNKKMVAKVSGTNPGYGATVVALLQSALTVLQHTDKMPPPGGVLTTGVAFRNTDLIQRLHHNGLHFEIVQK
ncbi:putative saccharopine dehydrogenase [Papilio machaon]|uniref:Putative saccharopine dehydrogenase n=1 Tax=Papilio machaon TaxID=76193 RepID=A0A194R9R0_PAPMA|nr:putative saccharopine dehydrogenase [Papilio machaon]